MKNILKWSILIFTYAISQQVSVLEHDTDVGSYNSIVQVDSDTYALAYTGDGDDGFITTFTISSNGSSITEVATLEHDTDNGKYNCIIQVDSDTYVLAYAGEGNDGYIKTFTISSDGSTITEVASLEHDNVTGYYNSIVQVDSDTYALAYASGDSWIGYLTTFTIPSDGSTITEVASLNHDTGTSKNNSIVQVDSDTYVLAYTNSNNYGAIATFTIPSDGSTITEVASSNHDTNNGTYNSLAQVDTDTYVLAYAGSGIDGYIKTFTISSNGSTISQVASLEHNTTDGGYNSIVQVDSDTYVLAYAGYGDDGFITTFTISADGSSITEVEELEHDTDNGTYNSLVKIDSDTYALAYSGEGADMYGEGADGYIKTFSVATDGSLPVELTSFEVLDTRDNGITLHWITESEINNLGFILDRRTPTIDWIEIASFVTDTELQGQGSVSHQTIYTYSDNTVTDDETYDYRIADVDYDGNKEYHSLQLMGISPASIPITYVLHQNYPNPFNPITTLSYDLPEDALVNITIYDMMGRIVNNLVSSQQNAGYKSIQWNATNNIGQPVSAGLYLYTIQAGEFRQTRKMVLLK